MEAGRRPAGDDAPAETLVVHPGALGDLVCLFPLLAELRERHGPLALLCQAAPGRLARAEGLVDAALPLEAAWSASLFGGAASPEARRRLAGVARVVLFSRAPGLAAALAAIAEKGRVHVLRPRPPAGERRHVADHARQGLVACGLLPEAAPPPEAFRPPPPRPREGKRVVFLHPGAGSPRKRWPLVSFRRTAEGLAREGYAPRWLLGPAEEDLARELARDPRPLSRLSDPVELAQLLRTACGYIGNDAGATHLAAWAGIPTVALFGPSDPRRWGPRGAAVTVVAAPCAAGPCFETAEENCAEGACLAAIDPAAVIRAFRSQESAWRSHAASKP